MKLKQSLYTIILIFAIIGMGGCSKNEKFVSSEPTSPVAVPSVEPSIEFPAVPPVENPDYIVFKNIEYFDYGLIAGGWQVLTECKEGGECREVRDVYHEYTYNTLNMKPMMNEIQDSVYNTRIVSILKNVYGYEIIKESSASTSKIWLTHLDHDTLYYTSPEYPPKITWTAKKMDSKDYIEISLEKQYESLISDINCFRAAVIGETDYIVGKWQLMKDIENNIDYSCETIIYDFHTDSTLTISNDVDNYVAGSYRYEYSAYPFCPLCNPVLSPPPNLIIDKKGVFCQVLRKTMLLYGSEAGEGLKKVFIKIQNS